MEIREGDDIAQAKANEIFETLDDYARQELVRVGTAFTTYEDFGDQVCAALEHRARVWYANKTA